MDLDEYLWRNKIKMKDFSKEIGVPMTTLSLIKNRKTSPSLHTAICIVEGSNEEIEFANLLKTQDIEGIEKFREKRKNA